MGGNAGRVGMSLSLKLALAFAGSAMLGIVLAAVVVSRVTSNEFGRYLQHAGIMSRMMGPGMSAMMGIPERDFLDSVRSALWLAAGGAVGLSILAALFVSRQITAPVRRLSVAARQVARGDLTCRVPQGPDDEVGRLAGTFNAMVNSLQQNQEARRGLMADLAHEMATPLSVMQSNLEGILDGVVEPSRDNISSLHEEALLLSRLVNDLRTLGQAESGRLELYPRLADVGGIVASAVRTTDGDARRRNIALSLEVAPDLPEAPLDADRVSQVMTNLLINALRYTSEGGSVKVAVRGPGAGVPDRDSILVSVSDTGQGISERDLPRVFDRYFRGAPASGGRDGRAGGSGIGLAVVKGLVEAHGGRVWVESKPGAGSTFFFTLPIRVG